MSQESFSKVSRAEGQRIFSTLDFDGDGMITEAEMRDALKAYPNIAQQLGLTIERKQKAVVRNLFETMLGLDSPHERFPIKLEDFCTYFVDMSLDPRLNASDLATPDVSPIKQGRSSTGYPSQYNGPADTPVQDPLGDPSLPNQPQISMPGGQAHGEGGWAFGPGPRLFKNDREIAEEEGGSVLAVLDSSIAAWKDRHVRVLGQQLMFAEDSASPPLQSVTLTPFSKAEKLKKEHFGRRNCWILTVHPEEGPVFMFSSKAASVTEWWTDKVFGIVDALPGTEQHHHPLKFIFDSFQQPPPRPNRTVFDQ